MRVQREGDDEMKDVLMVSGAVSRKKRIFYKHLCSITYSTSMDTGWHTSEPKTAKCK